MSVLSPYWLLGLLPWGVVVYWLLRRRRWPTGIPFLELWRGPFRPPRPTHRFARPPLPVAMVMLAMLLAILAAARPAIGDPTGRRAKPIPVVVDRGAGMSVRGGARLRETFAALQRGLMENRVGVLRLLHLHAVPDAGVRRTDVSDLTNPLPFPLTAADTRSAVVATTSRVLAETSGPVIVLSDQLLNIADDRVIQVPPPPNVPFRNVGIVRLAARAAPRPQVMVTVGGQGWTDAVRVVVSTGGVESGATVEAPPDGQTRDAFVDVPTLGPTVEARLVAGGDASADDRAWLMREGASPRIETRAAPDPAVRRVIESYAALRPPTDGSAKVLVVTDEADAARTRAVVIPARRDGKSVGGPFTVTSHPLTREFDFGAIADAAFVTDPPAGWTPLVRRGQDVWVAVRESPVRQVWVGFDAPEWARTPAFVVFWAGLLDWVGGAGAEPAYVGSGVGTAGPEWGPPAGAEANVDAKWWPGLYVRGDGALRAVNSGLVTPGAGAPPGDWRVRLAAFQQADRVHFGSPLLLAALAAALVAAAAWTRPSLTEISGKTTVTSDGVLTEARAARAEAKSRPNPDEPGRPNLSPGALRRPD